MFRKMCSMWWPTFRQLQITIHLHIWAPYLLLLHLPQSTFSAEDLWLFLQTLNHTYVIGANFNAKYEAWGYRWKNITAIYRPISLLYAHVWKIFLLKSTWRLTLGPHLKIKRKQLNNRSVLLKSDYDHL